MLEEGTDKSDVDLMNDDETGVYHTHISLLLHIRTRAKEAAAAKEAFRHHLSDTWNVLNMRIALSAGEE